MRLRPSPLAVGLTITVVGMGALVGLGLRALDAEPPRLPGRSFSGTPPPLDEDGRALREQLRADVSALAEQIGERNTARPGSLARAADRLTARLREMGLSVTRQVYVVDGVEQANLYVDVGRHRHAQLLIGAHYDSAPGSPGGNDNASGVAVLLALAERLGREPPAGWVRLAWFVNEEPPHFRTPTMGSHVYAAWAADRAQLPDRAVVLDSVGAYSSRPSSQRFPSPRLVRMFGDRGDFVAFVGDSDSEELLMRFGAAFRRAASIRSEGAAFPADLAGVTWSDHASFWRHGVPAILVSDTATFRDPHYHEPTDDGAQVDYDALVHLTGGLEAAIRAEAVR